MGFLNKKKSMEELEDKKERNEVLKEIAEQEATISEKKALVAQMDERYGKGRWRKMFRIKMSTTSAVTKTDVMGISKMRQYLGLH